MTDSPTPRPRRRRRAVGSSMLGVMAALPFVPFLFTLMTGGGFDWTLFASGLAVFMVGGIILAITVIH